MKSTLLLFLSVVVVSEILACPPQPAPAAATTPAAAAGGRKRRSVEHVSLTLVTNADFDPATNGASYEKVKTILREFARANNVVYDRSQITEAVRESSGKFAIEYSGNLDCQGVKQFVQGVKSQTNEIAHVLLHCNSQPLQIL